MARTELPQLWLFVMGSPRPNFKNSITERKQQVHECESLEGAVELHVELIKRNYHYELLWLQKHKTMKAVKIKMRASKARCTLFLDQTGRRPRHRSTSRLRRPSVSSSRYATTTARRYRS